MIGLWLVVAAVSMPGPMYVTASAEARSERHVAPVVVMTPMTPAEAAEREAELEKGIAQEEAAELRELFCPLCHAFPIDTPGGFCPKKQCQWTEQLERDHPSWGRETCVLIGEHLIRIGMTREQVRESWGSPIGVSSSIYGSRVYEHWRWGSYLTGGTRQSVMFVNGRLENIHNY